MNKDKAREMLEEKLGEGHRKLDEALTLPGTPSSLAVPKLEEEIALYEWLIERL